MKQTISNRLLAGLTAILAVFSFTGCKENLNAPELPETSSDPVPQAVTIAEEDVAGLWTATDSLNTYRLELTAPEDGEAVLSHLFVNATSRMPDSIMNMAYTFTLSEGVFTFTPSAAALRQGASPIIGIHLGNKQLALFVNHTQYTNRICVLTYAQGPVPVITSVNKTMPLPGETVRIYGRNMQAIDHVYLPVADGWKEVPAPVITSKQITLVVPAGDYVQGSIRFYVSADRRNVYSPAYMFAKDGIMMHNFNEWGTAKADHYAGTEFEFTINDLGQLRSNVNYLASANLPAGHSLAGSSVLSPDSMLSFFGISPISWSVATGSDDKKGYLRFSTGDRLAAALARYQQATQPLVKGQMPCDELAIQMDIYAVMDGQPQWNTGYLSYRMNKDRNSTGDGSVANTAGWGQDAPMRFEEGWMTYTIPLTQFAMTKSLTLDQLISNLISGNLQTILTVMNYQLDSDHPAHEVSDFQFSVANIRLVPLATPNSTIE